jgi:hypothetical protein
MHCNHHNTGTIRCVEKRWEERGEESVRGDENTRREYEEIRVERREQRREERKGKKRGEQKSVKRREG